MELLDLHTVNNPDHHFTAQPEKPTKKPPDGVGEEWPKLLTKKWLAIHFGCFNGHEILRHRFRSQVLTTDVIQRAGISEERAYSRNTRTFTAIESRMLTQILRGFCLIAFLIVSTITTAQTPSTAPTVKYSRDKFLRDTFLGQAMLTDSTIRMVSAGTGFRYEKVLSSIVVDAFMVKEYRFLVRASDGGEEPFDMNQAFFLLTGGRIDPNRIMLFKQFEK